ncbi:MAG: hypothetical protein MZW92_38865 [Comamonadaceae bacterium]|nr:hypothetical protein [Comamonadaceae bacterium]
MLAAAALAGAALFAVGASLSLFTGRGALKGGAAHAADRRRHRAPRRTRSARCSGRVSGSARQVHADWRARGD